MINLNKKIFFVFGILICAFLIIFFTICAYKKINIGNNIISKNTSEIVDAILNMSSYKANIDVKVISNKNENIYKIIQEDKIGKIFKQEIQEPSNIKGTIINYIGNDLKIENTKLNLSKIYQNYPNLIGNDLLLSTFVEEYKTSKNVVKQEDNDKILLIIRRGKKQKTKDTYNRQKNSKTCKFRNKGCHTGH